MGRYFGWEESDYGNLAMVRGVLEGNFLHYDMNHLPLYYGLSAAVMGVVGDAVLASRLVSLAAGVATVALGVLLADRLFGRRASWVAGVLLVFQPELALYSASSLREPVYAAALLGSFLALLNKRLVIASLLAGAAFLTRMDALLAFVPVLAIHALGARPRWRRLGRTLLPVAAVVFAWSAYCHVDHGTWAFWGHSVSVNVETGAAPETPGFGQWFSNGMSISLALFFRVLPGRMGWLLWGAWLLGMFALPWRRHDIRRTLALAGLSLLGFWLGVALVAQHEPGHNLYWKWLHGVMPFLLVSAAASLWVVSEAMARWLGPLGARALVVLVVGEALWGMGQETRRQLEVSAVLYKPQLEIARQLEAESAEGAVLLVDNIPANWLNRRDHTLKLWSWFDVREGEPESWTLEEFGTWLQAERVEQVLWFKEEWTQAPRVAPWLANGERLDAGPVVLEPRDREEEYGWILYRVDAGGEAP